MIDWQSGWEDLAKHLKRRHQLSYTYETLGPDGAPSFAILRLSSIRGPADVVPEFACYRGQTTYSIPTVKGILQVASHLEGDSWLGHHFQLLEPLHARKDRGTQDDSDSDDALDLHRWAVHSGGRVGVWVIPAGTHG